MEPNPKSVVVINATDSSYQLPSGGGPINQLPNEMMLLVLKKVNSDGDVKKLVRLRLVATRWNWLIEHYCKQNKSLIVNGARFFTSDLNNSAPQIVNLKTFDFFGTLLKLFPNIEQLAIGEYFRGGNGSRFYPSEDTKICDFAAKINSLASLKRLELERSNLKVLPHLAPTLSRLEYIRVKANYQSGIYTEMNQFISHLGSSCVRVVFGYPLVYSQVREWYNINPSWLASLTHLEFCTGWVGEVEDGVKIVHYLSKHSTRLKTLKYACFVCTFANNFLQLTKVFLKDYAHPLKMTPTLIGALANLANLTVLELWDVHMDIPELDKAASQRQLTSLSSVLECDFYISSGSPTKGDQFTRVLSAIFPNLTNLHLDIGRHFSTNPSFLNMVKQNVNRFPNLLKHKIDFF